MKRFSRCVLILILVAILSGVGGYMYENKMIYPMYESTTQLYVVPGEENEASIRANNGGLKEDFTIIFKSSVVISAAQLFDLVVLYIKLYIKSSYFMQNSFILHNIFDIY